MKKRAECYHCGAPATGRDHVPPLAFFPEQKDLPVGSPGYRRNLITLPACDAHNNALSGDDRIAAYAILAEERVNAVGLWHQATKVRRATSLDRRLSSRVLLGVREAVKSTGERGLIVTIDIKALNRVLDRVAKGLYFHDTGLRWTEELRIVSDSLMARDQSRPYEASMELLRRGMAQAPWHGENPDVFRYQWFAFPARRTRVLRMIFYGGFEFVAIPFGATTGGRARSVSS